MALHVWGCSSVLCVGCFVCAGPGDSAGLCWAHAGCGGRPVKPVWELTCWSNFHPFSAISYCVAHSHTSRNRKNLTFILIWADFFSCGIFRFEKPQEELGQQGKGAGSSHCCAHLQPAQACCCHWNGEYPLSGKSLPSKGHQASYPHPSVKRMTKWIQWWWLKEPRAVPQAPFLASLLLRRAVPWLIPRVLLPPTFPGLGGEPKPDPWDVTLLWNTNCYGCPGLCVSTIQCCLIPFCVHSGRTAGILQVGSCYIHNPGEREGETTSGKVSGVEMCVHICLAFMKCSGNVKKNKSDWC